MPEILKTGIADILSSSHLHINSRQSIFSLGTGYHVQELTTFRNPFQADPGLRYVMHAVVLIRSLIYRQALLDQCCLNGCSKWLVTQATKSYINKMCSKHYICWWNTTKYLFSNISITFQTHNHIYVVVASIRSPCTVTMWPAYPKYMPPHSIQSTTEQQMIFSVYKSVMVNINLTQPSGSDHNVISSGWMVPWVKCLFIVAGAYMDYLKPPWNIYILHAGCIKICIGLQAYTACQRGFKTKY